MLFSFCIFESEREASFVFNTKQQIESRAAGNGGLPCSSRPSRPLQSADKKICYIQVLKSHDKNVLCSSAPIIVLTFLHFPKLALISSCWPPLFKRSGSFFLICSEPLLFITFEGELQFGAATVPPVIWRWFPFCLFPFCRLYLRILWSLITSRRRNGRILIKNEGFCADQTGCWQL